MKYIIPALIALLLLECHPHTKSFTIPKFSVLLLDSVTRLKTDQIKSGKPIILIYFSPDCEYCQKETESILHSMDSLRNIQFYFITNDEFSRLKVFNKYYKIYKYKNIALCQDDSFYFIRLYKNAAPPYTVLYDEDKMFRAVWSGETTANQLITLLKKM